MDFIETFFKVFKGNDLFLLRSDKDEVGLSVHSSGVHGVEGFVGSAVQIAYLNELASLIDDD